MTSAAAWAWSRAACVRAAITQVRPKFDGIDDLLKRRPVQLRPIHKHDQSRGVWAIGRENERAVRVVGRVVGHARTFDVTMCNSRSSTWPTKAAIGITTCARL